MGLVLSISGRTVRWLNRWQPSESVLLGGVALAVGLTSGVGVWAFKRLIDLVHAVAFGGLGRVAGHPGGWMVFLVPVAGGLAVGALAHWLIPEERHHGVAGVMEAVALASGRLKYRRMPAKVVAAAVSIGAGASVGPEDPSVQIGSNLGSMFGQLAGLSDERVRALVAAGAAGGIAAAFNAPIAGLFFALEVLLGELSGNAFGVVALSAVISAIFTQAVSGPEPAFHVPQHAFLSIRELPLYLGLGALAGPLSALYIRSLYLAQDVFRSWHLPRYLKPALAGLAVGLVGILLPQVFGVGYETLEKILGGEMLGLNLLLLLLAAKLLLTPISLAGGFVGGVFAPSLFLGATLGGAYGAVAARLFPGVPIAAPAFAMIGMAAVLAGAVRAPLTAIILLFEMTNDYRIILPLIFAVAVSVIISQHLQRDSVYTLGLARRGLRLQGGRDVDVLEGIAVGEAMEAVHDALHEGDPLPGAAELLAQTRHHGMLVLDDAGELVGVFTVQDLQRAQGEGRAAASTVGQACTRDLLTAFPDETLGAALRRMAPRDIGRLPIVARSNPRQLLGLLRRSDVIRAYDVALARRVAMRHRAHEVRLDAVSGASVEEIVVAPGAPCSGQTISRIGLPRECIIASVRRGRRIIVPHGDTVLEPGDVVVVVVAEGDVREQIRACLAQALDEC